MWNTAFEQMLREHLDNSTHHVRNIFQSFENTVIGERLPFVKGCLEDQTVVTDFEANG